jgi:hypothetical protein
LIEEEFLERALRCGEQLREEPGPELGREWIDTEFAKRGTGFGRFPRIDAAEMAAISEAEDTFV